MTRQLFAPTDKHSSLCRDVRVGLTATPKTLPPKYFYDARGSQLFDDITRLPEYYPTRAETAILQLHAAEIAARSGCVTLVELGSGTSVKSRLLLSALSAGGTLKNFVPFDVDPVVLDEGAAGLSAEFPWLSVAPVIGDFELHLSELALADGPMMIAFLGSTIGNLEPPARTSFLRSVAAVLRRGDTFLLGTDLVKDPVRLQRAYDDSAGVTAEFNRNVLLVLNRELGADFDPDSFEHIALWDVDNQWIEMRLRSTRAQQVTIADLELNLSFAAGEDIRTEISAKFRPEGIAAELAAAGMISERLWLDPDGDVGLTIARLSPDR